jgi:L-fucose mutarotase
MGKCGKVIRCDGHGVPELLDAILQLFPLDTYVEYPVTLMSVVPGDNVETPIWDKYKEIIAKHDERGAKTIKNISRFDFYDAAKSSYAVVATGESALYACIILKKGVIKE